MDINNSETDARMFSHAADGKSLLHDYVCETYLGGGVYGIVYKAHSRNNDTFHVAIKIQVESPEHPSEALEESRILKHLNTLFAVVNKDSKLIAVSEKAAPLVHIYDASADHLSSEHLSRWVKDNPKISPYTRSNNYTQLEKRLYDYEDYDESEIEIPSNLIHISVLELIPQTLDAYMSQNSATSIFGLVVQLISTLYILQEKTQFMHWDLKADNVGLRMYPLEKHFYYDLDGTNICIPAKDTMGQLIVLLDFGTASVEAECFRTVKYARWGTFYLSVYYQRNPENPKENDARDVYNPSFDTNKIAIDLLVQSHSVVQQMGDPARKLLVAMTLAMSIDADSDIDNDTKAIYHGETNRRLTPEETKEIVDGLKTQKDILTVIRDDVSKYTAQMHHQFRTVSYGKIWNLVLYPQPRSPSLRDIVASKQDLFVPYINNTTLPPKNIIDLSLHPHCEKSQQPR